VIFDNDYVRAVEFILKPGDNLPLHKGHPRIVYVLSDYKIKWTEGDKTSEKEWKKVNVHWHDAIEHAIENTGDKDAHFIVVARKKTALPETGEYDLSRDASTIGLFIPNQGVLSRFFLACPDLSGIYALIIFSNSCNFDLLK
jgi:hypothetical protein